jgi:hypothetical protein
MNGLLEYRRRAQDAVDRRPPAVRTLAVLAAWHALALAGVVWWTVVFYDVISGPDERAGTAGSVTLGGLAVLLAAGWAVLVVGVWQGREDAREAMYQLGWLWVWSSVLLSLLAFFVPLVLTAIAGYSLRLVQQEEVRAWTAVSPAPGPGSPRR